MRLGSMKRGLDPQAGPTVREATLSDLPAINGIVERAIATWRLPERVKRLAMPSYRYHPHDLGHLHIVVETHGDAAIAGVAAWEPAPARECPRGRRGLLLHGTYVDPAHQRRGTGTRLLAAAAAAARAQHGDGLLVKAQADATPFFSSQGLVQLPVEDPDRDYPHRFWLAL